MMKKYAEMLAEKQMQNQTELIRMAMPAMVYNRKTQTRIPVIDNHLNTPCVSANENLMPKPESQKSI